VVTPGICGTSYRLSCSMHPRLRRFQPQASRASNSETGVSAPYSGGLLVTLLQKARSHSESSRWPRGGGWCSGRAARRLKSAADMPCGSGGTCRLVRRQLCMTPCSQLAAATLHWLMLGWERCLCSKLPRLGEISAQLELPAELQQPQAATHPLLLQYAHVRAAFAKDMLLDGGFDAQVVQVHPTLARGPALGRYHLRWPQTLGQAFIIWQLGAARAASPAPLAVRARAEERWHGRAGAASGDTLLAPHNRPPARCDPP
jgi:hypothetical protein